MAGFVRNTSSFNCTNVPKNKVWTPMADFGVNVLITYAIPTICVLGVFGNICSFIIMKESGKKISSHFFIKILTIFDCMSLIFFLPAAWANLVVRPLYHQYWPGEFTWIDDFSSIPYICEARLYVTFVTRTISIHIIVAFTIERGIMVVFPYHGQRWCNMRNAKITVTALVLFTAVFNIMTWFCFERRKIPCSGGIIICKTTDLFHKYRLIKFMLLSVIPSIVIVVVNLAIIVTLNKRRGASYIGNAEQEAIKARDKEITNRLLLVSTTFFVLNVPLLITTTVHTYYRLVLKSRKLNQGAWANAFIITLFLFYLNLAVNFILYCMTGRTFRRAAIALFTFNFEEMRRQRQMLDSPRDSNSVQTVKTDASSRRESELPPHQLEPLNIEISKPSQNLSTEAVALTPPVKSANGKSEGV